MYIDHYDLTVGIEFQPEYLPLDAPGYLSVAAEMKVINDSDLPVSTLEFVLYRLFDTNDIYVNGVLTKCDQTLARLHGMPRHQVNHVKVELTELLRPGEKCWVKMKYRGICAGAREVWQYMWDSVTRRYTLLRHDVIWYPELCAPDLDNLRMSQHRKKTFRVKVQIPKDYQAVGPGQREQVNRNVTAFTVEVPRERCDLAIAPFVVHYC
ncbi:MAG: hypothetical protein K6T83_07400 [Alicyclobacillus sp.]|nr:hypothetical protein [Alicyclobacillus sp.]